jgi:hypothetical protein
VYLAAVLELRELGMGLAFKLVLGPAIVAVLFAGLLDARGETIQITIFEASMAPQIGAAIVAVDHDLGPALVDPDGRHRYPALVPHGSPLVVRLEAARALATFALTPARHV